MLDVNAFEYFDYPVLTLQKYVKETVFLKSVNKYNYLTALSVFPIYLNYWEQHVFVYRKYLIMNASGINLCQT